MVEVSLEQIFLLKNISATIFFIQYLNLILGTVCIQSQSLTQSELKKKKISIYSKMGKSSCQLASNQRFFGIFVPYFLFNSIT